MIEAVEPKHHTVEVPSFLMRMIGGGSPKPTQGRVEIEAPVSAGMTMQVIRAPLPQEDEPQCPVPSAEVIDMTEWPIMQGASNVTVPDGGVTDEVIRPLYSLRPVNIPGYGWMIRFDAYAETLNRLLTVIEDAQEKFAVLRDAAKAG